MFVFNLRNNEAPQYMNKRRIIATRVLSSLGSSYGAWKKLNRMQFILKGLSPFYQPNTKLSRNSDHAQCFILGCFLPSKDSFRNSMPVVAEAAGSSQPASVSRSQPYPLQSAENCSKEKQEKWYPLWSWGFCIAIRFLRGPTRTRTHTHIV